MPVNSHLDITNHNHRSLSHLPIISSHIQRHLVLPNGPTTPTLYIYHFQQLCEQTPFERMPILLKDFLTEWSSTKPYNRGMHRIMFICISNIISCCSSFHNFIIEWLFIFNTNIFLMALRRSVDTARVLGALF